MKFLTWWWKEYDVKNSIILFIVLFGIFFAPVAVYGVFIILEHHFFGTQWLEILGAIVLLSVVYGGMFWVFVIDPIKSVKSRWDRKKRWEDESEDAG